MLGEQSIDALHAEFIALGVLGLVDAVGVEQQAVAAVHFKIKVLRDALDGMLGKEDVVGEEAERMSAEARISTDGAQALLERSHGGEAGEELAMRRQSLAGKRHAR